MCAPHSVSRCRGRIAIIFSATLAGLRHKIAIPLLAMSLLAYLTASASAEDNYGAFAFSENTGAYGYSYDHSSRGSAEKDALNRCSGSCTVVLWFKNACGALAAGDGHGYGTGWAGNRSRAEEIAMSNCEERTDDCKLLAWACTTR